MKLYQKIVFLGVISLLFNACQREKPVVYGEYQYLESLRERIIHMSYITTTDREWFKSWTYDVNYTIPDSIIIKSQKREYFKNNKSLPDFIKKAIVDEYQVMFMTMGELFLARPELADSVLIWPNPFMLDEINLYLKKYQRGKVAPDGPCWHFKNGFLWDWGTS